MTDERRPRPLASLRKLILAAERRAAHEAASSAVRGAAEELREQLPELDGDLSALADEVFGALRQWIHHAAEPGLTSRTAHSIALSATRGALDELERQWREGGLPLHDFFERVNHLLDRAAVFAAEKADVLSNPEDRAYRVAFSVMDGAVDRLHDAVPQMSADFEAFGPSAAKTAAAVGEGFFGGVARSAKAEAAAFQPLAAGFAGAAGDAFFGAASARAREEAAAFTPLLETAGRAIAQGATAGAAMELEAAGRAFARGMTAGAGAEAEAAGRAFARGVTAGAADELEARLRKWMPALKRAGASVAAGFGALTALWVVGGRLRRA